MNEDEDEGVISGHMGGGGLFEDRYCSDIRKTATGFGHKIAFWIKIALT